MTIAAMTEALERPPAFTTRAAAARRLGVTEKTIDRAIKIGQLKAIKVAGTVRISLASLEALEA
jgi:excisionase family DNA binding protein